MNFSKKALLLGVFGAAVVAAIVYAFLPHPVPVDLATVEQGPLMVTVDEDGQTRIKEKYVVSAPMSGRLRRIELDPGDPVVRGKTLLAVIEPKDPELLDDRVRAEAEAKVKAAEAALKRSEVAMQRVKAEYEFAQSEHKRLTELYQNNAASESDFEKAMMNFRTRSQEMKSAQFDEEIARFELEMAKAVLLRSSLNSDASHHGQALKIHAPITGRVLHVYQESSTVVSAGSQLLELGNLADLEVVVDVLSSDAVQIQSGARVLLEQWGGDRPLEGVVRLVEPQAFTKISALGVEEQRVNVIIDFLKSPKERQTLGDGFRVEARIVVWESDDVLKVPTSALFRRGNQWNVFVVEGDRAALRLVQIGRHNGLEAQVLDGLEAGERVIIYPSDKIKPGVAIVARNVQER